MGDSPEAPRDSAALPSPTPLQSSRFAGRQAFQQLVRDALSSAAAQGGFRQTPQGPGIGNVDQIAVIDKLEWFHLDSFTVAARSVLAIA